MNIKSEWLHILATYNPETQSLNLNLNGEMYNDSEDDLNRLALDITKILEAEE